MLIFNGQLQQLLLLTSQPVKVLLALQEAGWYLATGLQQDFAAAVYAWGEAVFLLLGEQVSLAPTGHKVTPQVLCMLWWQHHMGRGCT